MSRRLFVGAGAVLTMRVAATVMTFAIAVLLARMLKADGYGDYTYARTVVMMLMLFALGGREQLLVREVAVCDRTGTWDVARGLVGWAAAAAALTSVVMVVAAVVVIDHLVQPEEPLATTLKVTLALVPLVAVNRIRSAAMRGVRRVVTAVLPETLLQPLLLVLALAALWLLSRPPSNPAVAAGLLVASTLAAAAVGVLLLFKVVPAEARRATPSYATGSWLRASLPFFLLDLLHFGNGRADVLLLGALRDSADVGVYSVAARGGALMALLLQSLNTVLSPDVARLAASVEDGTRDDDRGAELQRLVSRSVGLLFLATAATAGLFLLGAELFLGLFGEEFQAGRPAFAILVLGQLVNVAFGPVGMLLNMTGYERDVVAGVGFSAAFNVVANLVMIPRFGALGAAAATTASLVLWNLILLLRVRARLGIDPTLWSSFRTLLRR